MPDPIVVDTAALRRQAAGTAADAAGVGDAGAAVLGGLEAMALAESDPVVAAALAEASDRASVGLRALVEGLEGCSRALAAEVTVWEEIEAAALREAEPS